MRQSKLVIIAVLILLSAVVILQNRESVETRLLFVTLVMSKAVLLLATLLIGFAVGLLAATRFGVVNSKS